jgi:hypothetical protein
MHRLESSTAQVNAALDYCRENKVDIFAPVKHIGRPLIKSMSFKQRPKTKRNLLENLLSRFA